VRGKTFLALVFVLCVAVLVIGYCQWPQLVNKYAINDDVRQANYILTYQDPGLFKADIITAYYKRWNPLGVKAFYAIVGKVCDPVQATKMVPFVLCLLSVYYIFKIGMLSEGIHAALLSGILFIFVTWSRDMFTVFGTSNGPDFAYLLFILFLYFYLRKKIFLVALILLLLPLFILRCFLSVP